MNRVVKPDGYVIISEIISNNLNPAQEVHKLFHHFRSRIDRLTGSFHRKTFSSDAILNLLKQTELPVQFYFEHRSNMNLLEDDSELEFKVERMRQMIEKIKGRPNMICFIRRLKNSEKSDGTRASGAYKACYCLQEKSFELAL